MIQLNLLPDVKIEYIKARRTKRLVIFSSIAVSAAALSVMVIIGSITYGAQKFQLKNLEKSLAEDKKTLLATPDLNKVLTVQNQLNALDGIHSATPLTSRLNGYLQQVTPNEAQISLVSLQYIDSTIEVSGLATNIETVNKYVDTLKFTKYKTDPSSDVQTPAFSTVVLGSWSTNEKGTTYSIKFKFDPALFSRANKQVTLVVPNIISTRSTTEQPKALYNESPSAKEAK